MSFLNVMLIQHLWLLHICLEIVEVCQQGDEPLSQSWEGEITKPSQPVGTAHHHNLLSLREGKNYISPPLINSCTADDRLNVDAEFAE